MADHALPPRSLVNIVGGEVGTSSGECTFKFKVMTYNILADSYAHADWHPKCPVGALSWSYRRPKILEEIRGYGADVVCLQEVQKNHYRDQILPAMQDLGYSGEFEPKRWHRERFSDRVDGCATFYRDAVFELESRHVVEFDDVFSNGEFQAMAQAWIRSRRGRVGERSSPYYRFKKGNTALILKLSRKGRGSSLYVANTHLHSDPNNCDIRVWQAKMLLENLDTLVKAEQYQWPVIIAADLNSLPESSVLRLILYGEPDISHPDHSSRPLHVLPRAQRVHTLDLKSAYSDFFEAAASTSDADTLSLIQGQLELMDPTHQQPKFTNYGTGFKDELFVGTLDYIFYSHRHRLRVTSLLELVPEASVQATRLPYYHSPSDHIPLLAEFAFHSGSD